MSVVARGLDALVAELTRKGSPLATFLQPSLPEKEVRSRLSSAGAHAHSDVISLYGWHNGFDRFQVPISSQGMVSLVPAHPEFNSLDETLELFVSLVKMAKEQAEIPQRLAGGSWGTTDPDEIWPRTWFPIFQGGGSEVVFVNNQKEDDGSVWVHPIQDSPRRLFDSLADAAGAVRQALADGRLLLDEKGVFTRASTKEAGLQI